MAEPIPFPADRPPAPRIDPLWRHLVGRQLRRRRHDRGETLADVAARAGVSVQYLSEVERGLKEPSSESLSAVVGALDGSLLELTSGIAEELRTTAAVPATARTVASPARAALALAA